jgi:hypothetical protein
MKTPNAFRENRFFSRIPNRNVKFTNCLTVKIQVLWDTTPCRDILRNVGNYLPIRATSNPTRLGYSPTLL